MTISIKAIIPPAVVNVDSVRLALLNQFRKTGRQAKRMLADASTFKDWDMKVSLGRGGTGGVTVTSNDEILNYIDKGTSIRWAVMSSDWQSKTVPGRKRARSGRGRVVIAGRRAMQARNIKPRPGIKGREFGATAAKDLDKEWPGDVQKAINKGLAKARG